MVVKITEEQFIQEMWAKHPKSFTTDGLRTIWDYVNSWDEGEFEEIESLVENSEDFLKINDKEYIEIL